MASSRKEKRPRFNFPPAELKGPHVTDRLLAIVYTSYLEERLATLIQRRLVHGTRLQKESRREFGRNIHLAHAIGLISDTEAHDLDVVAQIRNLFAHGTTHVRFDSPDVSSLVGKLKWGRAMAKNPKHAFQFAIWTLRNFLGSRRKNIQHIRPRRDYDPTLTGR